MKRYYFKDSERDIQDCFIEALRQEGIWLEDIADMNEEEEWEYLMSVMEENGVQCIIEGEVFP